MNYKNLKNIVTSAAFAAGILFVNGCSDPSENAKNEEFPEVSRPSRSKGMSRLSTNTPRGLPPWSR